MCIPTIPPRLDLYHRALDSVTLAAQAMDARHPGMPVQVNTVTDIPKLGAAATRDAALQAVSTYWTAFLDDDDTMDQDHLWRLYEAAQEHNADYLWSRFRIGYPGGRRAAGPSPLGAGTFEQWNDDQPAQTTVTTLVRTALAQDVGFQHAHQVDGDQINGQRAGEDWAFTLGCRAAGAVFRHVPHVTWTWNHHGANTSGLPDRW